MRWSAVKVLFHGCHIYFQIHGVNNYRHISPVSADLTLLSWSAMLIDGLWVKFRLKKFHGNSLMQLRSARLGLRVRVVTDSLDQVRCSDTSQYVMFIVDIHMYINIVSEEWRGCHSGPPSFCVVTLGIGLGFSPGLVQIFTVQYFSHLFPLLASTLIDCCCTDESLCDLLVEVTKLRYEIRLFTPLALSDAMNIHLFIPQRISLKSVSNVTWQST